ncbi:hypothetical protein VPHK460_0061 [Vibrio phage K460]
MVTYSSQLLKVDGDNLVNYSEYNGHQREKFQQKSLI